MFSKALLATNLSETSTRAVQCLKQLTGIGTRDLLLVNVMDIREVGPYQGALYHELPRLAAPKMEEQKELLEQMGFAVESAMLLGIPHHEINRLAAEKNASLIIVYTKAHSIAPDYFVGGVAHDVINRADKPVLVLRARSTDEAGRERCDLLCEDLFQHILFPTDFSDSAERAFTYLERIVEGGALTVTLLHVQEKTRIEPRLSDRLEEFNRIDRSRLDGLKARLIQKGAKTVHTEIVYGSGPGQIIERARANHFSLIVMGSQGRGFIKEVFLGSTSHQVLRHAPVPLLLVPSPR